MDKLTFIQNWVIRTAPVPKTEQIGHAIGVGEMLWEELSKKGYGDKKTALSKSKTDSYSALSDRQRSFFDNFWNAFNYKKDRENAVKRWAQLGELDDLLYQKIIEAATKEAARDFGNLTRKMAQGWLADKRYLDDYSNETHQQLQTTGRKLSHAELAEQNLQRTAETGHTFDMPSVESNDCHLQP